MTSHSRAVRSRDPWVALSCPSGKRAYRTRHYARVVGRELQGRFSHPARAYRCELCPQYHLTTQPKRRS